MKKLIKLTALLLVWGTCVCAAAPAAIKAHRAPLKNEIAFFQLNTGKGFGIRITKEVTGKSLVIISDKEHNILFKDRLSDTPVAEKAYILTELPYGDYTVEVISNNQSVKKQLHVYEEDGVKSYIFII